MLRHVTRLAWEDLKMSNVMFTLPRPYAEAIVVANELPSHSGASPEDALTATQPASLPELEKGDQKEGKTVLAFEKKELEKPPSPAPLKQMQWQK